MATVSDDFNRVDNTSLGVTSVGGLTWQQSVAGGWQIVSNQAKHVNLFSAGGSPPTAAWVDLGVPDATLAVTIGTAQSEGIVARVANSSSLLYINRTTIYSFGGTFTTLSTHSSTLGIGDVLTVVLAGTSVIAKKNGTTVSSITTSFNLTATGHGIGSEVTADVLDDWSAVYTPLAVPPRRPLAVVTRMALVRASVR